jgi:hypothetical protein
MIALSRPYTPASGGPLTAGSIIVCGKSPVRSKTEHLILMRREKIERRREMIAWGREMIARGD